MYVVQQGDTVQLHYTTYAADGCVIETSVHREPLEFVVGSGEVISGVNRAVIGMSPNERRRIAVSPEHAFGFRDTSLQQTAPRIGMLEKIDEGDQLVVEINGQMLDVWIRSIGEDEISLDANHPLAGESLVYEIEVVQIRTNIAAD